MEDIKYNDSTRNRPEGERPLDAPAVRMDFHQRLSQLKNEPMWRQRDRTAITLFHSERMRVVLVALHDGAELPEHRVAGPVTIQVLEGRVTINAGAEEMVVAEGEAVALQDAVPHRVRAEGESAVLLTLAAGAGPDPY